MNRYGKSGYDLKNMVWMTYWTADDKGLRLRASEIVGFLSAGSYFCYVLLKNRTQHLIRGGANVHGNDLHRVDRHTFGLNQVPEDLQADWIQYRRALKDKPPPKPPQPKMLTAPPEDDDDPFSD